MRVATIHAATHGPWTKFETSVVVAIGNFVYPEE
jgi:hypothetical protein